MTRKQHSARFKAKVAMEAIRGGKPRNELAARCGLHATPIAPGKKQALEGWPERSRAAGEGRGAGGNPLPADRAAAAGGRVA